MLRVLHVLEALEGGTARHLVDVVGSVHGVEHHIAAPARRVGGLTDEAALDRCRRLGARVHVVPMSRSPARAANALAPARLRRLLAAVDPDVVHGHSSVGGALARLAALGTGRAVVYTPNGIATGRAALAVERLLGRLTERFVAVSRSEAELARRHRLVPAERLVVIPNGVRPAEPSPGALRERLGVGPGQPLVGTVSRLVAQKAPERFVAMAGAVLRARPEAHAVLVGDGPLRGRVEAALGEAGLARDPRFHLVPSLADAARVMGDLDVFVLTSRFEGAPYAPMEAMAAGVPVVATDVVGTRDVVEPGCGVLVPEHDVARLATEVLALLGDPERRSRLGEAGRAMVAERFSVEVMGRRLAALYRSMAPDAAWSGPS